METQSQMNNLQLATALAAPTGVGLLYTAYEQGPDSAVWKNGAGTGRSIVSLERTQPKPTLSFPGVERFSFKRSVYLTVNDVEYVSVATITTSIPVVIALADRTAMHLHIALLARDPVIKDAMETGAIPT